MTLKRKPDMPRDFVQRVVLLSYDPAAKRISLRHYSIHTAPSGVTKGVKSVVAGTALPALSQLQDISELLLQSGYGSVCPPFKQLVRSGEYLLALWLLLDVLWLVSILNSGR